MAQVEGRVGHKVSRLEKPMDWDICGFSLCPFLIASPLSSYDVLGHFAFFVNRLYMKRNVCRPQNTQGDVLSHGGRQCQRA